MEIFTSFDQIDAEGPEAVSLCVGVFDGVHRGHQWLLERTLHHGRRLGIPSLVITFANHPLDFLAPPYAPPLLTTAEEKVELLEQYGADLCLLLEFDGALAATPPEEFLERLVMGACRARHLVCGRDFRFGARGAGDVAMLEREAPRLGLGLEVCDDLVDNDAPVRSSRVRTRLLEGEVEEAARLLGRPYALRGLVVAGDRRGRTIGYPTANIEAPERRLAPRNGVYAVRVATGGHEFEGMLNIGVRPTFETHRRTIEAHLFDFEGDLYGQTLTVKLIAKIRDERRFDGVEALVAQLRRDENESRKVLRAGA